MANGKKPHIGAFACPPSIPLGWLVRVGGAAAEKLAKLGLPNYGVCADRFAKKYRRHLDVAIPKNYMKMTDGERLKLAFLFGRMTDYVTFEPSSTNTAN